MKTSKLQVAPDLRRWGKVKYEQRPVYLVKYSDGEVARVFGIEATATEYAEEMGLTVDEWPVEFEVTE